MDCTVSTQTTALFRATNFFQKESKLLFYQLNPNPPLLDLFFAKLRNIIVAVLNKLYKACKKIELIIKELKDWKLNFQSGQAEVESQLHFLDMLQTK